MSVLVVRNSAAEGRGVADDNFEMGTDLLSGIFGRRPLRFHRHIGGVGGCGAVPVLCLRRDLFGLADPGPHDLSGVAVNAVIANEAPNYPMRHSGMVRKHRARNLEIPGSICIAPE